MLPMRAFRRFISRGVKRVQTRSLLISGTGFFGIGALPMTTASGRTVDLSARRTAFARMSFFLGGGVRNYRRAASRVA